MRDQCIKSVESAIGRKLKVGESKEIEQRIIDAKKQLAAQDRQAWRGLTESERLSQAGEYAAKQIMAELAKKQQRAALQILAASKHQAAIDDMATRGIDSQDAINRLLVNYYDGKSGVESLDSRAKSVRVEALSQLQEAFGALNGRWLGFISDKAAMREFAKVVHGDLRNADPEMIAAAQAWRDVTTQLRERFNRAGGDVGLLDDWGLPHHHSLGRITKAGKAAWVADTAPMLNRDRYVNEDGSLMNDQQLNEFLGHSYDSIVLDGANKHEFGTPKFGGGARANRGSESRMIHFKDGEAWADYQERFGDKGMLDVMTGHIRSITTDIAMVEVMGPNPEAAWKMLQSDAKARDVIAGKDVEKAGKHEGRNAALWAEATGQNQPVSANTANLWRAYRNLNVASLLGGTVMSAITDGATMTMQANAHGLAVRKVFGRQLKGLVSSKDRAVARDLGLGIDEWLNSINRFNDDGLVESSGWSNTAMKLSERAGSAVMRVSGLNALTAANKAAFSKMLLAKYGEVTRSMDWSAIDPNTKKFLEGSGVTEQDWRIWKMSDTLDDAGSQYLHATSILRADDAKVLEVIAPDVARTPENIAAYKDTIQRAKTDAASRLMSHVLDEQGLAVLEAGAREKAKLYGKTEKGTWQGEFFRSLLQFKSFTAAFMMRHGTRMMAQETRASKAIYGIKLLALTTIFGGIAVQLANLVAGRDPDDMTSPDFLWKSMLKGGGMGIYGDVINGGMTKGNTGFTASMLGPIVADMDRLAKIGNSGYRDFAGEGNSSAANEAYKLLKGHLPMQNLWYTKAATDRLLFNQMQEMINPGYLRRQEQRQREKFDTSYWWNQDEMTPDDMPDFEKAVGQ